jgi:hypothetical protein
LNFPLLSGKEPVPLVKIWWGYTVFFLIDDFWDTLYDQKKFSWIYMNSTSVDAYNNDWCKSLGTNVGLDCEFAQATRKLIHFTSDRAMSED